MTTTPAVIADYLRASAADDTVACFTGDAEVQDEGRTMRGHDEIRKWRKATSAAYDYAVTVLDTRAEGGDSYVVDTKVDGNFPGGTVDLTYRFTLREGLISALRIAPRGG